MTVMPNAPEVSSPPSVKSTTRFGARAVLAAVALALVAVPGALILLLVEDKWAPLLRADDGARDRLHNFAVTHTGFVGAMQLISDSGSALAWQIVLAVVVVWLLWRRLPRLALFVVVTAAGSSLLNTLVKTSVHRLRPVLTHPVAHESGLSFPSGHAQAAIVGYAVLLLVLPADPAWSVAESRRRGRGADGFSDRLLPDRSRRPLRVRRRGRLRPGCGVGGGHGSCLQRDARRSWTPPRGCAGGARARAGAAHVRPPNRRRPGPGRSRLRSQAVSERPAPKVKIRHRCLAVTLS